MEKMSIVEYIALSEHVTSGLKKQLRNCFFMDYGREATVEVNDDNTITCTMIKSRRYHEATKIENREIIKLKLSTETGEVLNHVEDFVCVKTENATLTKTSKTKK